MASSTQPARNPGGADAPMPGAPPAGGPVARTGARVSLLGRADECAVLDRLIDDVRRGESRSLVLRGEAGIGKTALLKYLVESTSDLTVARAVGVESEMELPFASLHQLCAPLLERLDRLPAPQRQALEIVFGLSAGAAPDRFLVGLAVLSLGSGAFAAFQRHLGRIDDLLDPSRSQTFSYNARGELGSLTSSSIPFTPFLNSTIPLPRLRPTSGSRLPKISSPRAPMMIHSVRPGIPMASV